MTPDECLSAAWTYCAPNRLETVSFCTGFWPDVARVAMAMYAQQTDKPELDFEPSKCTRGNAPEPRITGTKVSKRTGIDLDKLEISI